jgi:hypothetical protein
VTGTATLHLTPVETFRHEIDIEGDCICGPERRYVTSGVTGRTYPYWRHMAADQRFYETQAPETKETSSR